MNSVTADGLIISQSAGDCLLFCVGTITCYFFIQQRMKEFIH